MRIRPSKGFLVSFLGVLALLAFGLWVLFWMADSIEEAVSEEDPVESMD